MDRNALAELLQALESRRDAEERRREERYTALIERLVFFRTQAFTEHFDTSSAIFVAFSDTELSQPRHPKRKCRQNPNRIFFKDWKISKLLKALFDRNPYSIYFL
ncbi:UNVERIFIED_CONTAM: hypothetical protein FKN15_063922 [Acipenser sinensis]